MLILMHLQSLIFWWRDKGLHSLSISNTIFPAFMFFLQNRRSLCGFLQKDQQNQQCSCNQEESKPIKGLYPVFKGYTKEAHGLENDSTTNVDISKLVYINGKSSITAFKNIDLNLNSQRFLIKLESTKLKRVVL